MRAAKIFLVAAILLINLVGTMISDGAPHHRQKLQGHGKIEEDIRLEELSIPSEDDQSDRNTERQQLIDPPGVYHNRNRPGRAVKLPEN